MLSDPLTVKSLDLSVASSISVFATASYAVTDISPGRSVRIASASGADMPAKLTIAHTVSNENKPVKTDRTLIRLDYTGYSPASAGPVVASAYMVVAIPQASLVAIDDNAIDASKLVQDLIGVVAVSPSAATLSRANLLRILAGEP
jgi:hypothetical protein